MNNRTKRRSRQVGGSEGGRYVECDEKGCTATFSLHLSWSKDGQTLHEARRAGWFIQSTAAGHNRDRHLCPIHHPNDLT